MYVEQFKHDLLNLGLKKGDSVMIHCSYKALGVNITPEEIFDSLKNILSDDGNLILPAFSYETVNYENPLFDRKSTPSCVGFLPEFFRMQGGVVRSMHATHSCSVWGADKEYFIHNHELDLTPVGANSPITKLPQKDGKILILGSHPDHNTALHGIEEKANAPYIFDYTKRINYILKDGERVIGQSALRHDFTKKDCWYEQKYSRIIDILPNEAYKTGKVLNANSYLMQADAVWEKGIEKLKEDPYFFVNRISL